MELKRVLSPLARLAVALAITQTGIFAQDSSPCPRFPVGSVITAPDDLFSRDGVLRVQLSYQTTTDANGNTLYSFVNSDGAQSPTLHIYPGDRLIITLTNNVLLIGPSAAMPMPAMTMASTPSSTCGAVTMNSASVNIHYHGTNTPPTCHQDEVIRTLINSGETFEYDVQFPDDEPPGLYWHHPHVHGISQAAVQGGASGALIVEGIENVTPVVAGLPQQLLIIRDNQAPGSPTPGGNVPAWDISLNYVPIAYPAFTPAVIQMKPQRRQSTRRMVYIRKTNP